MIMLDYCCLSASNRDFYHVSSTQETGNYADSSCRAPFTPNAGLEDTDKSVATLFLNRIVVSSLLPYTGFLEQRQLIFHVQTWKIESIEIQLVFGI